MQLIDIYNIPENATAISTDGRLFVAWSEIVKAPTIEAVPISDIYKVIAGHSDYHGDDILAALTCIAEGKTVNPVKPIEYKSVRHGRWERTSDGAAYCTACKRKMNPSQYGYGFCGLCGAKMDLK